ncbi:MAG: hypothetical protein ACE5G8_11110 [Anaerolineae bacterium]
MSHVFFKRGLNQSGDRGQGLVEYALLLVLVAVVVIGILLLLGPQIGGVFSSVANALGAGGGAVAITKAEYKSDDHKLHLDATYNGGYDSTVTLTASPGGTMEAKSDHYHRKFTLTGCPCTVTVTSSKGGSASVTVGP